MSVCPYFLSQQILLILIYSGYLVSPPIFFPNTSGAETANITLKYYIGGHPSNNHLKSSFSYILNRKYCEKAF